MDYLDRVAIDRHVSWRAFCEWRRAEGKRLVLLTTKAEETLWDFAFRRDDVIMVGRESAGVPQEVHDDADARVRIAIRPAMRSAQCQRRGGARAGRGAAPDRTRREGDRMTHAILEARQRAASAWFEDLQAENHRRSRKA